jgi:cell division protein FtsW (lipid II flippase)
MGFRPLLVFIAPATLVCGIIQISLINEGPTPASELLWLAIALAGLAPLFCAAALPRLVPGSDIVIVACAALLTAVSINALFGLAMASGPDQAFYATVVTRHGFFVAAGFLAMIVGAVLARRSDVLARYPFSLLLAGIALIAITVVFGESVNGARLWLSLGPVRFQPSEIARFFFAVFLATYLYDRRHLVSSPWRLWAIELPPAPYLLPLVGAVLAAVAILFVQNDLGMAALIVLGAAAATTSVIQSRLSAALMAVTLAVAAVAAFAFVPRVRERVAGWLDPWQDPMGRGFQFIQADFALAPAGPLGRVAQPGATRVPEVQTDFVLVAIGSQLGFAVAVAVMALGAVLVMRCGLNALRSGSGLDSLLGACLSVLFGLQFLLIVGGSLRVLPLTGLTWPLVSYGGTSMVVTLFSLGVVIGVGLPHKAATVGGGSPRRQ